MICLFISVNPNQVKVPELKASQGKAELGDVTTVIAGRLLVHPEGKIQYVPEGQDEPNQPKKRLRRQDGSRRRLPRKKSKKDPKNAEATNTARPKTNGKERNDPKNTKATNIAVPKINKRERTDPKNTKAMNTAGPKPNKRKRNRKGNKGADDKNKDTLGNPFGRNVKSDKNKKPLAKADNGKRKSAVKAKPPKVRKMQ